MRYAKIALKIWQTEKFYNEEIFHMFSSPDGDLRKLLLHQFPQMNHPGIFVVSIFHNLPFDLIIFNHVIENDEIK